MKWFTADLHLGHQQSLNFPLRKGKFPTISDWDDHVLAAISHCVSKTDTLFILGDLTFRRLAYYRQRIKGGQVWLIKGNHDPSDKVCREVFDRQFRQTFMTKVDGTPTWLSHYAHAYWPSSHRGAYHLYGHTHAQREEILDKLFPNRRSMDAGVDNAYRLLGEWRPFSELEIKDYLNSRSGHDPVQPLARAAAGV